MKVLCISGKAQSGKDTSASIIASILSEKNISYVTIHYADLLKYICKTYFNWNGEKDEIGRTLLQYVGTDIVRKSNPNFWVNFVKDFLQMFKSKWDFVLIPDARFPNEIEIMKDVFETYHLRVVRDNFDDKLDDNQRKHASEIALDSYPYDFLVNNNSTKEHLFNICSEIINNIIGEEK